MGGAGQGTNSPKEELGRGSQRGKAFTMAPVQISLLACADSRRSLMTTKTLPKSPKMPAAKTMILKKTFKKLVSLMRTRNTWGARV